MWDSVRSKSDEVGLTRVPMLKGDFLIKKPISHGEDP